MFEVSDYHFPPHSSYLIIVQLYLFLKLISSRLFFPTFNCPLFYFHSRNGLLSNFPYTSSFPVPTERFDRLKIFHFVSLNSEQQINSHVRQFLSTIWVHYFTLCIMVEGDN